MKYQVIYLRQKAKKKAHSKQIAVFYTIEDAFFWKSVIESQGAKEVTIQPL